MNSKWFSNFASYLSTMTGRPGTFVVAASLVIVWAITGPFFHYSDTWQLVINTATTIVTFLLVALLQNTQKRADDAVQHKLNAIAEGLSNLMEHSAGKDNPELRRDCKELRAAVGLENREGA
jgi:low affinity Fe/Cu permease